MSKTEINSAATSSASSEFNEIIRGIDDNVLANAMTDPFSRALVLHAVFAEMPHRVIGERIENVEAVVRWQIGNPAAIWTVIIENGCCTVHEGIAGSQPTVTMEIDMVMFLRLIAGQVGGMALMLSGRLRIKGNLMTARKIEDWFVRS
ncbi:SCP2 sterol-binding domain-containing protein [Nocardia sp. NPDC051570]|uniref:SCP2 sterol-binding domain-containing protein n=1 Tax=Nocardia sp. NPDC051570 TaxID=3364324 RepID=UPI00379EE5E9